MFLKVCLFFGFDFFSYLNFLIELAWVMSRTPEITAEVQKKIDESCKTYLNPDLLLPTQQDKDV